MLPVVLWTHSLSLCLCLSLSLSGLLSQNSLSRLSQQRRLSSPLSQLLVHADLCCVPNQLRPRGLPMSLIRTPEVKHSTFSAGPLSGSRVSGASQRMPFYWTRKQYNETLTSSCKRIIINRRWRDLIVSVYQIVTLAGPTGPAHLEPLWACSHWESYIAHPPPHAFSPSHSLTYLSHANQLLIHTYNICLWCSRAYLCLYV